MSDVAYSRHSSTAPLNPGDLQEPEVLSPPPPLEKWSLPPEPHKPYLPYKRGFSFVIHRHIPVAPFGSYYARAPYAQHGEQRKELFFPDLSKTTVADLCHAHPPLEGTTLYETSRQLEITEAIEVKDGHGAQIFACRLDSEPTEYVAKVYDPLYYGFTDLMWSDLPRDVTYVADGDYSREVAAYEHLEKCGFRGAEVPSYHGSWTFDLPTDTVYTNRAGNHTRPVRMILIEYLHGRTMLQMNVARTSVDHRFDILSRMGEAESRLSHIGLYHNDVSQRNVMVCGLSPLAPPTRVCLFDFNIATVAEYSKDAVENEYVREKTGLPGSPADFLWNTHTYDFDNWFPEDWKDQTREWHQWLLDKYTGSTLFEPPQRNLKDDAIKDYPIDLESFRRGFPSDDGWETGDLEEKAPSTSPDPALPTNQASPKRSRDEFEGDGLGSNLELRAPKAFDRDTAPTCAKDAHILGHISIGVKDYHTARLFYSGALEPLGLHLVYISEDPGRSSIIRTLGYGPDEDTELLNIFEYGEEAHAPGRGCHIAFNAPNRKAVDKFHEQALLWGGTCDGKPGLRPRYGPSYYAAFVISPDSWRLEAVCKTPE
ncbi:hypothetical protein GE09DRAFT_1108225 [Coniochaeta sp. 2T2.1]|nr:hypothetical protein GE09DRAFT_1108225 [Coniochaeta sp. 2T2.1]